jgi:hypothetical protein
VSADQPTRPQPRRLGEDQSMPGGFLVGFTQGLTDRREQLLRQGEPPGTARERAVAEAVQAFAVGAGQRGWTVQERRIAQLADDTLGLEEEFRDRHGYEPDVARLYAVGEVLEGERAREELPSSWLRQPNPPDHQERQSSQRTGPDSRTDTVRTREGGRER